MTESMAESQVTQPWSLRWALAALSALGLAFALVLVRVKLRLELDPSYESSCNFGATFNCDRVQTSAASTVFGRPLALFGAATYAAVLGLALLRPTRQTALSLSAFGVPVLLHSAWLAYVSSAVIGAFCLYCVAMYLCNIGIFIVAALSVRSAPAEALRHLARQPATWAVPMAAAALSTAVAVASHDFVRASWEEERKAASATLFAVPTPAPAAVVQAGASVAAEPLRPAGAAPAATGVAGAASAVPVGAASQSLMHDEGFRYSEAVSSKGRTYFEVPIDHDGDFARGPRDAKVNVVLFADFQCGYCRSLANHLLPLEARYEGKVRWVFKHFPLDNRCNPVMKGTMHDEACAAAKAANCVGLQGRFWDFHHKLYATDLRANDENLRRLALESGAEAKAYDACYADEQMAHAKTRRDVQAGRFARIAGTPRTYIQGHLVPGIVSTEVFASMLDAALAQAAEPGAPAGEAAVALAAVPAHGMIEAVGPEGRFFIDAYEASLDAAGRARTVANVAPAEVSWNEADEACRKAGKRLCTELEWISACAGAVARDDGAPGNLGPGAAGNGDPTDDAIEGNLYPYGPFYDGGRCWDDAGNDGAPVSTGSRAGCRSVSGIHDQSGNLAEWTGTSLATAMLSGGDFRYGAKATCMVRQDRFGRGYRNRTTGFRCCAATAVPQPTDAEVVAHIDHGAEGQQAPTLDLPLRPKAPGHAAGRLGPDAFRGKVTVVSFFASWCGPCRREMPELDAFYRAHAAKGLQVFGIGVDVRPADAERFIDEVKPSFPIAIDPEAESMGLFGVKGMPTTYLIGRDGRIVARLIGINAEKVKVFQDRALALLAAP